MFRVGKVQEATALADPKARPVIHGNGKLGGFVRVNADTCDDEALNRWLGLSLAHVAALPAKD